MSRRDPDQMLSTPPPLLQAPAMHESRAGDRTPVHYTMMAHSRPAPAPAPALTGSYSRSLSPPPRTSKIHKSTTPASSPRAPYSVGQNHPPKLSPARPPEMRAPSPNYFGLVLEPGQGPHDSPGLPRDNWSLASSSIKSFGAALPKHVALESNPDFEAFKRQVDINRGNSFAPPTSHYMQPTSHPARARPRPPRWHTHASDTGLDVPFGRSLITMKDRPASRMDIDQDNLHDSAYVSSDSKRNSESSPPPLQITSMPRFESPRPIDAVQQRTNLTRAEDTDPRLSMMEHRPDPPSPSLLDAARATTLPGKFEPGQPDMITATELTALLETVGEDRLLLLDIRSSQNFAISRISGSLNLCIPTTLLKRATFNTERLQQTFQANSEGSKFATWPNTQWIIVYDAHSSDKRDAVAAQNMIKKFTNENYGGRTGILRGGFSSFQESFSELVDYVSATEKKGGNPDSTGQKANLAPVIGGVMLPTCTNSFNPFFSNIRQNMDLADGVGQLDISWPDGLEPSALPQWLREAAALSDHGKKVSDKFLRIEQEEQSRMQKAYAASNQDNAGQHGIIQLSGVEKGGKNRYKDILPFEHARVRLQNKPEGGCDYINASHLTASRSNKRYIASQGPMPDTFEDFWSATWEQDVRVIVMLTAESEGGQLKCHHYWKEHESGIMRLKPLSEKKVSLDIDKHPSDSPSGAPSETHRRRANTATTTETPNAPAAQEQTESPHVIVRKFALSHAAYPFAPIREITQLHFASWPDFGTPAQPSHLLALVELANVIQRAAQSAETTSVGGSGKESNDGVPFAWSDQPEADDGYRPMLVHCSAGCGRTGTFCTVDSVIDMLKRQRLTKAFTGRPRPRRLETDVSMVDPDSVISLANRELGFNFNLDRAATLEKGRYGEYPQLDISWLPDDSVDLVQSTVEDFREQRISMVQSLRQFVLCYETVLEWINRVDGWGMTATTGGRR